MVILVTGVDLLRAFAPFGANALLNTLPSFLPAVLIPLAITQQYLHISYKTVLFQATAVNAGYLSYEYLQQYIPWTTFDTNDVIAIFVGHCLFMVVFSLIILFQRNRAKARR